MTEPIVTEPIDPARLVFVGGLHRSGTSPLARVIGAHAEVSGLHGTGVREDEGQHLQPVYPKAKVHGGSGRFAHAPAAHLTETSPLATPENAAAMLAAWSPHWDLTRPMLVEKSPPNLIMGRFLQQTFPGSALVVVVRHPVTVALSTKKWRRFTSSDPRKFESLSAMVEHWLVAHAILREDLRQLDRAVVVHYERLVADPTPELARVQELLGLSVPFAADGLSAARGQEYAQRWDELDSPLRPGGWQRRTIERHHAAAMADYGYAVDDVLGVEVSAVSPWGAAG